MVLNRVARNLVTARLPDFALMHDAWIYLVLSALGEIRFDPQPGMLYRQHAQNTIGVGPSGIKKWVWRTRRFFARKQRYSDQVVEFRKLFADHLTADQIRLVDLVIGARNSFAGRVCLALSRRVYRQRAIDDALLRLVALVGRL
jgi:hypothetical protein